MEKQGHPPGNVPSAYAPPGYVPSAPVYPGQSSAGYLPQHMQYGYPYPQGPPPSYSVAVGLPPTQTAPTYTPATTYFPYGNPTPVQQYVPQVGIMYPTVAVQVPAGSFDAGARFDGKNPASIPPPPPGCIPNAAQLSAMQGHNVVVGQKKGGFWTSGSDGGVSFW